MKTPLQELREKNIKDFQELQAKMFNDILITVCKFHGVTKEEIIGKERIQIIAQARAVLCYFAIKYGFTSIYISEQINHNHATVLCAERKIAFQKDHYENLRNIVNDIEAELKLLINF